MMKEQILRPALALTGWRFELFDDPERYVVATHPKHEPVILCQNGDVQQLVSGEDLPRGLIPRARTYSEVPLHCGCGKTFRAAVGPDGYGQCPNCLAWSLCGNENDSLVATDAEILDWLDCEDVDERFARAKGLVYAVESVECKRVRDYVRAAISAENCRSTDSEILDWIEAYSGHLSDAIENARDDGRDDFSVKDWVLAAMAHQKRHHQPERQSGEEAPASTPPTGEAA